MTIQTRLEHASEILVHDPDDTAAHNVAAILVTVCDLQQKKIECLNRMVLNLTEQQGKILEKTIELERILKAKPTLEELDKRYWTRNCEFDEPNDTEEKELDMAIGRLVRSWFR